MTEIEGALLGGIIGCLPGPLGLLFHVRYAYRGWNAYAIAIHLEHDARVVGSRILRRPPTTAPTAWKARGRITI